MTSLTRNRIESIDVLKGLVMVIMALDHTRDFFYKSPSLLDVTDPANATAAVYLTDGLLIFAHQPFVFWLGYQLLW